VGRNQAPKSKANKASEGADILTRELHFFLSSQISNLLMQKGVQKEAQSFTKEIKEESLFQVLNQVYQKAIRRTKKQRHLQLVIKGPME